MPRPRSPNRDKAFEVYQQQNGNIENRRIAEQLGEDERLIAKWKHEDKWVESIKKNKGVHLSTNSVHQTSKKPTPNKAKKIPTNKSAKKSTPKAATGDKGGENGETNITSRGGAPIGNKNAAGNKGGKGAPLRNKHAIKTHEYATIFFTADIIDEEERAILSVDYDKYAQQITLIDTLKIREKRIMQEIRKIKETPGGMVFESVTKNKGKITTAYTKRNEDGDETPGSSNTVADDNTSHVAIPELERRMRLEESLTRVQGRLQRAIEMWHKMEQDDEYLAMDRDKLDLHRQKILGQYDLDAMIDEDDIELEL